MSPGTKAGLCTAAIFIMVFALCLYVSIYGRD